MNLLNLSKQTIKKLLTLPVLLAISPSYAAVPAEVQSVFMNNSCLVCHGATNPSGGLSLADADTSDAQLVNIGASCDGGQMRVIPGEPEDSVLYNKITLANPGCGGPMPPNAPQISAGDITTIYDWIVSIGPAGEFGLLQMDSTSVTVDESMDSVSVTVVRLLGQQETISVDYSVATIANDSATSPDDFIAATGTLSFDPNEASKTIVVDLVNDTIFEGSEVFSVTLSSVSGGAVLGMNAQTKVTIVDDEFADEPGTFFFDRVNYSADEGETELSLTVLRSFGAAGQVTVDLNSVNGTALSGMDFDSIDLTLVFAEGERSMVVSINVIDDQEIEGDEVFNMVLSNPTEGAQIAATNTVPFSIIDNDTDGGDAGDAGDGGDGGDGGGEIIEGEEAPFEAAGSMFSLLFYLLLLAVFPLLYKR